MRKWIVILCALLPSLAMAAGGNVHLDDANNDLTDKASLQRGAKMFMNYCFGCHATQYQRYQRVAEDLNIPKDLMEEHLIVDKNADYGELMTNAMSQESGAKYFGAPAPDLTLVSRVRGTIGSIPICVHSMSTHRVRLA
jgi:Cytochrome c1